MALFGFGTAKLGTSCSFHKDVKPILKLLAKQTCYAQASLQSRKDIRSPGGVLDPWLTRLFTKKSKIELPGLVPARSFFEAQGVGCVLTHDRLAAAGRVEAPSSRFCHASSESLPHLVRDCPCAAGIPAPTVP